ncbi:MAG: hypothetical protein AAFU85_07950, partial [Planctomycetota bacterium]
MDSPSEPHSKPTATDAAAKELGEMAAGRDPKTETESVRNANQRLDNEAWLSVPSSSEPKRQLIFHRIDPATLPIVRDSNDLVSIDSGSVEPGPSDVPEFAEDEAPVSERRRTPARRGDPIVHSLVMLITIFVILAAARFIVPGVVE